MSRKKILICGFPNTALRIFIKSLNSKYDVFFISCSGNHQYPQIKEIIGENAFIIDSSASHDIMKRMILSFKLIRKNKIDIFLTYHNNSTTNGLLILMVKWFFPSIQRIFFPYDILAYARPKELKYHTTNRFGFFLDRICYEKCDKIITKGFEGELKYLEGIYRIHEKPHFAFNFLIEKKDVVDKKNIELDVDDIQLVFIGGVSDSRCNDNNCEVFKEILNEKNITLHVYSHSSLDILKDFEHIEKLVIQPYITGHKELIKEISKYDFGVTISDPFEHEFIQAKMASGMRIYDYIAAGLPIIVDEKHELQANIVKINNFGIVIPRHDVKNIISHIKGHGYKQLITSIKKNREKFFAEKNISKLIAFLEK